MELKAKLWMRRCDVTLEGMDRGWVFGDGEWYFKYRRDALDHLENIFLNDEKLSEEKLFDLMIAEEVGYYTEWEDAEDIQYVEIEGLGVKEVV